MRDYSHHIWCNGAGFDGKPVDQCMWCAGPEGLWAKYPYGPEDNIFKLQEKYFPDARRIPDAKEQLIPTGPESDPKVEVQDSPHIPTQG